MFSCPCIFLIFFFFFGARRAGAVVASYFSPDWSFLAVVLYPPSSLVSSLCCAYTPARASQRAVHQGWAGPKKRHPRRNLPRSIIGGCNLARESQKKSEVCILHLRLKLWRSVDRQVGPLAIAGTEGSAALLFFVLFVFFFFGSLLRPWCWVQLLLQRAGPFDAESDWARWRRPVQLSVLLDEWVDVGRRGAPLRTDRVLHPLASPRIVFADDTQRLVTLSQSSACPSPVLPRPFRSSCYPIRRARLVLRMRTADHRP